MNIKFEDTPEEPKITGKEIYQRINTIIQELEQYTRTMKHLEKSGIKYKPYQTLEKEAYKLNQELETMYRREYK